MNLNSRVLLISQIATRENLSIFNNQIFVVERFRNIRRPDVAKTKDRSCRQQRNIFSRTYKDRHGQD